MFLSFTKSQCAAFSTANHSARISFDNIYTCATCRNGENDEIKEETLATLYDAPGVETTSHPLPFGLHNCVAANYCKWDALLLGEHKESEN